MLSSAIGLLKITTSKDNTVNFVTANSTLFKSVDVHRRGGGGEKLGADWIEGEIVGVVADKELLA